VLTAMERTEVGFRVYNVATGDYITVREIAELAVEVMDLPPGAVSFEFTGGNRGWKGDVPIVRLNTDRIGGIGWTCRLKTREALRTSMQSMLQDARLGRLWAA
jgi:UDP-glucose 4-epimerase